MHGWVEQQVDVSFSQINKEKKRKKKKDKIKEPIGEILNTYLNIWGNWDFLGDNGIVFRFQESFFV